MTEWKPIETAPRGQDEWILLWTGYDVTVGHYFYGDWRNEEGFVIEPEYWMELPDPPK